MEKLMELLNTNVTVYGFNLIMFFLMVIVILLVSAKYRHYRRVLENTDMWRYIGCHPGDTDIITITAKGEYNISRWSSLNPYNKDSECRWLSRTNGAYHVQDDVPIYWLPKPSIPEQLSWFDHNPNEGDQDAAIK